MEAHLRTGLWADVGEFAVSELLLGRHGPQKSPVGPPLTEAKMPYPEGQEANRTGHQEEED